MTTTTQQPPQPQTEQAPSNPHADVERLDLLRQAGQLVGQVAGWELAARALSAAPHPAAKLAGAGLGALAGGTAVESLVTERPLDALSANTEAALTGVGLASVINKIAPMYKAITPVPTTPSPPKIEKLAAKAIQQEGESDLKAITRLRQAVGRILRQTEATGGATYHLTAGDLSNAPAFAVSSAPDRTKILSHPPTPADIEDFVYRNSDLLARQDYAVGVWHNEAAKTWELDVSRTAMSVDDAIKTAQKNREIAIFSLKHKRNVPVWLDLIHYSREANLSQLDPAFVGTGSGGAEMTRVLHEGAPPRTNYYLRGTQPEPQLSKNGVYITQVRTDRLYDVVRDREGIVAQFKHPTDWEREIERRGYVGYFNTNAANPALQNSAVLFRPLPAIPLTKGEFPAGQIMLDLVPKQKFDPSVNEAVNKLGSLVFTYDPAPFSSWKGQVAEWIPDHLRPMIPPAAWWKAYQAAKESAMETIKTTMPASLPKLLAHVTEQSPYVQWDTHVMPVLREWVGERAPLMAAAIEATRTQSGANLNAAIKVYTTTLTAANPDTLQRTLRAMNVAPTEPFVAFAEQVMETGLNSAAVARQFHRMIRAITGDVTTSKIPMSALQGMAEAIRQRTLIRERQVVDTMEVASEFVERLATDPAQKPLWSALMKITTKNWDRWREKYNIPDLGTPELRRKLGLIAVLSAATSAGVNAAPPDARAALYQALQDDGLFLPPRTISRLTDVVGPIRAAYEGSEEEAWNSTNKS